jgi:hypothetical protein
MQELIARMREAAEQPSYSTEFACLCSRANILKLLGHIEDLEREFSTLREYADQLEINGIKLHAASRGLRQFLTENYLKQRIL